MGILNATPDSFHDGGQHNEPEAAAERALAMFEAGASIIDIGGQSSRPGAQRIDADEEASRVIPVIKAIRKQCDIFISVDTFYSSVARASIDEGADIINDISAGDLDSAMIDFVTENQVPYILMHMKGNPESMQKEPTYENVVGEVFTYLHDKVSLLRSRGHCDHIVDPGFGFGKTLAHNYKLMAELNQFSILNCPILVGVSRKSMINKLLDISSKDALNGTTALHVLALERGANILRVHDVGEAIEAVKIVSFTHSQRAH